MSSIPRGLVAFDLDGTLLRGATVCELLAQPLGRLEEMRRLEALTSEDDIARARQEMAGWYRGHDLAELQRSLTDAHWAPGAKEAVGMLQKEGVEVAIASITWRFAVSWFAQQLRVRHFLGTAMLSNGAIEHVWGRDKARWVSGLAGAYKLPLGRVAAVGDSTTDSELLCAAGVRIFVGANPPSSITDLIYLPGADLRTVAQRILDGWAA
jgi:phosphoserine phosphatase